APTGKIRIAPGGFESRIARPGRRAAQRERDHHRGADCQQPADALEERRALGHFYDSGNDGNSGAAGFPGEFWALGANVETRQAAARKSSRPGGRGRNAAFTRRRAVAPGYCRPAGQWRVARAPGFAETQRRGHGSIDRADGGFAGQLPGDFRIVSPGWLTGRDARAAARESIPGIGGGDPASLRWKCGSFGKRMRTKEKDNPDKQQAERQKVIDHLEKDVEELRRLSGDGEADSELERIRRQVAELRREFYTHLGAWQRAQLARHQQRPYTLDYVNYLFTDFMELHGDRGFADDKAIVA